MREKNNFVKRHVFFMEGPTFNVFIEYVPFLYYPKPQHFLKISKTQIEKLFLSSTLQRK